MICYPLITFICLFQCKPWGRPDDILNVLKSKIVAFSTNVMIPGLIAVRKDYSK